MVTPIFLNQTTPKIFTSISNVPSTINQNYYSFSHLEQMLEENINEIKQSLMELNEKQDELKDENECTINKIMTHVNKLYLSYTIKNSNDSLILHQISRQIQLLKESIQEQIIQTNHEIIETLKKTSA